MTTNENEAINLIAVLYDESGQKSLAEQVRAGLFLPFLPGASAIRILSEALSHRDSEKRRADEAEAELARVRRCGQWQLITDEQKDGKIILIRSGGDVYAAYWNMCPKAYGADPAFPWTILDETNGTNGLLKESATHWLPLPTPPERA